MGHLSRRSVVAAGSAAATVGFSSTAVAAPLPMPSAVSRICFGSCAHQDKDQPVWEAVLAQKPDLFVFLGDNIYGDTRDMKVLREKYAKLAAKPGFKKLRAEVPIAAVWDDHDYGEDDSGSDYPMRAESKAVFLEFWQEPANSPRRNRDGIYASYLLGPEGRRVQLILPDLRTNRTPITKLDLGGKDYKEWAKALNESGKPVPGPYTRMTGIADTMLGEPQWSWLADELKRPADVRLFGSSLQVLADFPGWESWAVYARDHQRLIDLIRRQRASGVLFLSGDTHYGELTKLDLNTPYPLWDVTSSGITEVWPVLPPNDLRVGPAVREVNFGMVEIAWAGAQTTITLQVRDVKGEMKLSQTIPLSSLSA